LITHHAAPFPTPNVTISQVPGEPSDPPLLTGRVYSFSKRTGGSLWPVPATIVHRGMHSTQHQDIPVLVFVQNALNVDSDGEKGNTTVLCLDKRTGQLIYRNDAIRFTPRANFDYQVSGNAKTGAVTIALPTATITLTLTGDPSPPEPPEQEAARTIKDKSGKGIFGIFGSTMKALGTPPEERQDDDDLFPPEKSEKAE